jgi:D-glycero-D-manno-heptose 1,7-bisphosphate phosphatase
MGEHQIIRSAVFLDRDGVLNRSIVRDGRPQPPAELKEFVLYDDAVVGCKRLREAGFLLVVISNQPDVGRGAQQRSTVEAINKKLIKAIPWLDRIEVCFHAGKDYGESCDCRKPKPGMLLRAAAELGIDLATSYVIGDRWRDVDCARAAGCYAIFINRDYNESLRERPDVIVGTFGEAVTAVLEAAGESPLLQTSRSAYARQRE